MSLIGYSTKIYFQDSLVKESDFALSLPCDLTDLLVRTGDLKEHVEDQLDDQQGVDETSLHSILTSTGFVLGAPGRDSTDCDMGTNI